MRHVNWQCHFNPHQSFIVYTAGHAAAANGERHVAMTNATPACA
jgi:hypothetical protein